MFCFDHRIHARRTKKMKTKLNDHRIRGTMWTKSNASNKIQRGHFLMKICNESQNDENERKKDAMKDRVEGRKSKVKRKETVSLTSLSPSSSSSSSSSDCCCCWGGRIMYKPKQRFRSSVNIDLKIYCRQSINRIAPKWHRAASFRVVFLHFLRILLSLLLLLLGLSFRQLVALCLFACECQKDDFTIGKKAK